MLAPLRHYIDGHDKLRAAKTLESGKDYGIG